MDKVLHSSKKHDWRTPGVVLDPVRELGPIGLDPCANPRHPIAKNWLASKGLETHWVKYKSRGLVYVNPPYGREIGKWVDKCIQEAKAGCEIILLVPSRTDTKWFNRAWKSMSAYCFWGGRITFVGAPAPAPFPSVLFYWGERPDVFGEVFEGAGLVDWK
jgi:hypothetical protein